MSVGSVVVVGGGISGCVTAISLAQRGVNVTLVERSPDWRGVGHGITVQGNALKVFREIGALDRMLQKAHPFTELKICHADGQVLTTLDTPRTGGPDLPATMGALRTDIQSVLVDMIRELGVEVRLGTELADFDNQETHVTAHLNDGTRLDTDVVVVAEGIKSTTRKKLGITEDRAPTGMGIWRVVTERTPQMSSAAVYYHGTSYKAGYTPISDTLCYAYVLTDPERPDNGLSDVDEMRRLLADYHGDMDTIRDNLSDDDYLNFQPIEWLMVGGSWHQGRVIAIGDAVHACPPLIAQGAAQCSEDALLLADYLTRDDDIEELMSQFEQRRKPRVALVVDASMQMVEWELRPDTPGADPAGLMGRSLAALTEPA